ncbi:hypothetical protein D3C85_1562570 [compost metagenome]
MTGGALGGFIIDLSQPLAQGAHGGAEFVFGGHHASPSAVILGLDPRIEPTGALKAGQVERVAQPDPRVKPEDDGKGMGAGKRAQAARPRWAEG